MANVSLLLHLLLGGELFKLLQQTSSFNTFIFILEKKEEKLLPSHAVCVCEPFSSLSVVKTLLVPVGEVFRFWFI